MQEFAPPTLKTWREGRTLWLQMATPNNTVGSALMADLEQALELHQADSSLKALVLAGSGEKFFCPGLDLAEVARLSRDEMRRFMQRFCGLYLKIFKHPKPTLAALNGHALAGGAILASCCDFRILHPEARIGLTGLNLTVPIPAGSLLILERGLRVRDLRKTLFLGENYAAQEALRLGWVDAVAEAGGVVEQAREWAGRLCEQSGQAFAAMKAPRVESLARDIEAQEAEFAEHFLDCWHSAEAQSQVQGLLERLKRN